MTKLTDEQIAEILQKAKIATIEALGGTFPEPLPLGTDEARMPPGGDQTGAGGILIDDIDTPEDDAFLKKLNETNPVLVESHRKHAATVARIEARKRKLNGKA